MPSNCPKCWCPANIGNGHNEGCPDHPEASPTAQAEWDKGWKRGFYEDDGNRRDFPNKSFAFGYRQGKAEIDAAADDAAQERCFG